jgi:ATP-dependent protease ClpP protease subunit
MTGHIFIEGEVGEEVTIESVRNDIAQYPQAKDWTIHIDSVGGDVDTGYAIGEIIQGLGKSTAQIGALCASISTYIAHSCDKIVMGPSGDFMIHLPTGTLQGATADEMRNGAARLERIKAELVRRYMPRVSKKGVTPQEVSAMLDKETSMSPDEALAMGFVDEVRQRLKAVAKLDTKKYMDTVTKKEVEGMFAKFGEKMDGFFARFKPKNIAVTLADGSTVNSDAADPSALVGSHLTDEQGAPLPPGTYETGDGYALVITDDQGTVVSADPITADKKDDASALKKENEALKQQIAQMTQEANASKNEVAAVAKQMATFKNEMNAELEKIKNQTFGDQTIPIDGVNKTKQAEPKNPMIEAIAGSLYEAYKTSH